jgi:hypothetical protein
MAGWFDGSGFWLDASVRMTPPTAPGWSACCVSCAPGQRAPIDRPAAC